MHGQEQEKRFDEGCKVQEFPEFYAYTTRGTTRTPNGFVKASEPSPGGTDGSIGVKVVTPFCFSVKQPANLICSQECWHKIKNSSVPMSRRHIRTDRRLIF